MAVREIPFETTATLSPHRRGVREAVIRL